MTTLTENPHAGAFIVSELDNYYSRDKIVLASGHGVILPGAVLGQITLGAATAAAKSGGNTGTGVFTIDPTNPVLANAKAGVYTVRCIAAATNSGTFRVTDPYGQTLGDVVVGATFADQIKFSIADGTPDFIVGDGFDVTVAAGSGKYVPAVATNSDGSQTAKAVNYAYADTTSADVSGTAITRSAQVRASDLIVDASLTATYAAQLAAVDGPIIVR